MEYVNSCLMLSMSLWTGIDLSGAFDDNDLKDTGIERDSHITIFYTDEKVIQREGLLENIRTILGGSDFLDRLKEDSKFKVLDYFELGKFENESDYVVLKLKKDTELFETLDILHTGLSAAYDIKSTFPEYTPHLTLAELNPGKAKQYMFSSVLGLLLETAMFKLDDFVLSNGTEDKKYKQFNVTSYNAVDRYFRQKELERDRMFYEGL